jgi:fibronectin type 3 domain-containing protein
MMFNNSLGRGRGALFLTLLVLAGCSNMANSGSSETSETREKLAAPTNLKAVTKSSSSIELSWTPVEGAAYYSIYRSADENWTDYTLVSVSVSVSVYTDTGLKPETDYYYKVAAKEKYTNDPEGARSVTATAKTEAAANPPVPDGPLSAPSNLEASPRSSSSIYITWTPVAGAEYYGLYRTTDSSWESYVLLSSSISSSAYTDYNLDPDTTYYYRVSAFKTYSNSSEGTRSDAASAKTPAVNSPAADPPGKPENLTATAEPNNTISLSWDEVEGAYEYYIYCSMTSGGPWVYVDWAYTPAYIFTSVSRMGVPLTSGTTYYFTVSAATSSGSEGELSDEANATTPAAGP